MLWHLHTSQSVIVILYRGWLLDGWLWSLQLWCWMSSSHSKSERNCDLVRRDAVSRLGTSTKCNPSLTMEHGSLKNVWCGKVCVFPSWEFTRCLRYSLCSLMMFLCWILRYECLSRWGPVTCCIRSVVRRIDSSCLESIVVGFLNLNLPTDC